MTEETNDHTSRITDLEIQLTYQEDLIAKLNDVIVEQANMLVDFSQRISVLESKLKAIGVNAVESGSVEENRPPHY